MTSVLLVLLAIACSSVIGYIALFMTVALTNFIWSADPALLALIVFAPVFVVTLIGTLFCSTFVVALWLPALVAALATLAATGIVVMASV